MQLGNRLAVFGDDRWPVLVVLAIVAVAACSAGPSARKADPATNAMFPSLPVNDAELGQVQLFVTDQTTDGRNMKLRGLLRNPYPEDVEGVRVLFYLS